MKRISLLAVLSAVALALPAPARATDVKFVDADWLAQHVNDADLRILDVRPGFADYLSGHIPGAVHFADSNVRGPDRGTPVQYLPNDMIARLLSRAGVTDRHRVVLYSDGEDVLGATMIAYVLERLRHPKDVMVLNGGFEAWQDGRKTTQAYPQYKPGRLTARDDKSIRVGLSEIRKIVGKKDRSVVIVDARPEKAFVGNVDIWQRNGHIPGAVNLDWHRLTESGNHHQLKSVDEMRRIVTEAGLKPENDVIVYCGTSREATLEFLALKHILGFDKVRLYEGSWTEYSAQPDLPVQTGPGAVSERR